jgi:hypothetical protein
MPMKCLSSLVMAGLLAGTSIMLAAEPQVAERLAALEAQVLRQQQELQALRAQIQHQDEQTQRLDATITQALDKVSYAQVKDAPLLKLGKTAANLELLGYLRVRYQREVRDSDDLARHDSFDRWRQAVRLGFKWQTTDGLEVGAGLATGGPEANSINDTYSDTAPFETGDIRLDYAYGKQRWEQDGDLASVTLGQMKNPFVSSWLLWDSDIRPVGLVGQYQMANGLFANLGVFDVAELGRSQTGVTLVGAQVGMNGQVGSGKYLTSLAYYHFNNAVEDLLPKGIEQDYRFEVLDLYGEYQQPVGQAHLKLYGDYFVNLGAEGGPGAGQLGGTLKPEDNDTSYLVGLESTWQKFTLGYAYAQVGADSWLTGLKDGDFGGTITGTDVQGHQLRTKYQLSPSLSLGVNYSLVESRHASDAQGSQLQVDTVFTF